MLKVIIISNNVEFIGEIIHALRIKQINFQIVGVAKSIYKAVKTFRPNSFDIAFIDENVITNKNKKISERFISKSVITSFADIPNSVSLVDSRMMENALSNDELVGTKSKIFDELKHAGYKSKYKGFHYLEDAILLSYIHKDSMVNNLKGTIYPIIAQKYNTSINGVKANIINATNSMYYDNDIEKLKSYFHLYDDMKPNIKDIISTIINKI